MRFILINAFLPTIEEIQKKLPLRFQNDAEAARSVLDSIKNAVVDSIQSDEPLKQAITGGSLLSESHRSKKPAMAEVPTIYRNMKLRIMAHPQSEDADLSQKLYNELEYYLVFSPDK